MPAKVQRRARSLAETHRIGADLRPRRDSTVRARLRAIEHRLAGICDRARSQSTETPRPGREWLLDNEFLIRETIRHTVECLPPRFCGELPRLAGGKIRVSELARAVLDSCYCPLEMSQVHRFLRTYQTRAPLRTSELWAFPAFLRLETLADLAAAAESGEASDFARESRIGERVLSLRVLRNEDWKGFFEAHSTVEARLREDPHGSYAGMDFETRDAYRKAVEHLARRGHRTESDVVETVIGLSLTEAGSVESHVGHWLVGRGRPRLEKMVRHRPGRLRRAGRALRRHRTGLYFAGLAALTAPILLLLLLAAGPPTGAPGIIAVLLAAAVPASGAGIAILNFLLALLCPPRRLPKMDFSKGLPREHRTIVAFPVLLGGEAQIDGLLRNLEVEALANPDPNLVFALLTDYPDTIGGPGPDLAPRLARAVEGIRTLNERYGGSEFARFRLFHRASRFNPAEGRFMGWERKRGKISEFLHLIRGAGDTSYETIEGGVEDLAEVRYLITLDADTHLPCGAANMLIAAMAHPLNRPVFSPEGDRVIDGYTVMQPRPETRPTDAARSAFARIFSGNVTLDLYAHAVSETYQDVFGEGIFAGKGIIDIDSFTRCLRDRVPENALLSHDLFEGIHGRAALADDIAVHEGHPSHVVTWLRRLHRWIRGDWQLLPWLLPRVPLRSGGRAPNRLSAISRWKILDNLRRSLHQPAVVVLFAAGWLAGPDAAIFTAAVAGLLGIPFVMGFVDGLFRGTRARLVNRRSRSLSTPRLGGERWLLSILLAPTEARSAVDAIARTLFRLIVSRRHLLEWVTAEEEETKLRRRPQAWRALSGALSAGPIAAAAATGLLALSAPAALLGALPVLILWAVSPWVLLWLSRPAVARQVPLTTAKMRELRRLARRTHLFFERSLSPEDHWLPPDNIAEAPRRSVAHRTSPTNIGLSMLAGLSALDLGYVGPLGLCALLRGAFDTLAKLPRHRGHFLNWYSTLDLEPLRPTYVSTVDSGNLACCLLALAEGLRDVARMSVCDPAAREGLRDTFEVLAETLSGLPDGDSARTANRILLELCSRLAALPEGLFAFSEFLEETSGEVLPHLDRLVMSLVEATAPALEHETIEEIHTWTERAHHHLHLWRRHLATVAPWVTAARRAGLDPERAPGELTALLDPPPALDEVEGRTSAIAAELSRVSGDGQPHLAELRASLETASFECGNLLRELTGLADRAERIAEEMDFSFLYDRRRKLLRIGYDTARRELDSNCYDLLASEARLASLFAIARGDVPATHWLHLGRPYSRAGRIPVLLSWGGSMFEYLMPLLLTRCPERSLLELACRSAVRCQMAHARGRGIPWGVSESGYYAFDAQKNYQYRSFGVPGLGLRRGLSEDQVVAPYATLLALPLFPHEVMANLDALRDLDLFGPLGLYEALDLTPLRAGEGRRGRVVRSYMAHHQGMIFASLANFLTGDRLIERFHRHQRIRTVSHLLFEQVPAHVPMEHYPVEKVAPAAPALSEEHATWSPGTATATPRWHLLSNGRYRVLIDNAGAGVSSLKSNDLTRFVEDSTLSGGGSFLYILDLANGALTSAAPEPTGPAEPGDEVVFSTSSVEFRRRSLGISSRLEVTVAAEDDVEIRRLAVVNETDQPRRLFVAWALEPVLAPRAESVRHPAFGKLFVEFEWVPDISALLCHRRLRAPDDPTLVLGTTVAQNGARPSSLVMETDRRRFLGRGGTFRRPAALSGVPAFGGVEAHPLDPVLSIGLPVDLPPFGRTELVFVTAAGERRRDVMDLLDRHRGSAAVSWAFTGARRHTAHIFQDAGLAPSRAPVLWDLLALLVTPQPGLRATPAMLAANRRSQAGLWPHGISGDRPVVLVELRRDELTPLLLDVARSLAIWRWMGFETDLVVLDHRGAGYLDPVRDRLLSEIRRVAPEEGVDAAGSLFVVRDEGLDDASRAVLFAAARAVLDANGPPLEEQLARARTPHRHLPHFSPTPMPESARPGPSRLPRPADLLFDNGLGGFTPDGREYVIHLEEGRMTPAPWVNVVARPGFGFLISESGSGTTWAENSGENRLTPWMNDPVSDPAGEALYIRDEETARLWSPTPGPAPGRGACEVRHGAGYSRFLRDCEGLDQELRVFAAFDAPVKVWALRIGNRLDRPRRLTVTLYLEWVLGTSRHVSQQYIVPEFDRETGAFLARNPFSIEFGERVAFAAASRDLHGLTADRTEFLGPRGDRARPAGLLRIGLSGRVEAGADTCGAIQIHIDLPAGASTECHFILGQGRDRTEALALVKRFRDPGAMEAAWDEMREGWERILGAVEVSTPDPALDVMLNRWLPWQTLSCRVLGRTGLYQSSGAFGFRDQLQDVLALLFSAPEVARAQILDAAARQFEEGDVLHWWHPPSGRGVRTRCSDDLLWLPFATAAYVAATGDGAILDEEVPWLGAPPLAEGEAERYEWFRASGAADSLYDHCRRALERGARFGSRGLPLIGTGDWNDGLNRLGRRGLGESVWLAWFFIATARAFAVMAEKRDDGRTAETLRGLSTDIARAAEESAWDGAWYLRAFTDDGEAVGGAGSRSCRIDAISQSWAVICGGADPDRARRALESVEEHLVLEADRLVLLLAPPFGRLSGDVGYIRAYPPGVRENGGQYTHAAAWVGFAHAALGDGDRAARILDLLNPVHRTLDAEGLERYLVEPYVLAGDIAGVPPHTGRGGWTWYTGSAAWTLRLGLEAVLGIRLEGGHLRIDPCIPKAWRDYGVKIRSGAALYEVHVRNPEGVCRGVVEVRCDGELLDGSLIPIPDDGRHHTVDVLLGATPGGAREVVG